MIGTSLAESLVQATAISHRIKGYKRASLLFLAAPESGKTTITKAADAHHVERIAVITGRSVLKSVNGDNHVEFLLFNDLSSIRAMSAPAVNLLITILNQLTQDEHGSVSFAGKDVEHIERAVGIIGCIPFKTFIDHRSKWQELGFVSRMIPFAYSYDAELVAEIKDAIDGGSHVSKARSTSKLPKADKTVSISMSDTHVKEVRRMADAKASKLGQIGIRLLQNYHVLVRAHALLKGRRAVTKDDVAFLRAVNEYVSISDCKPLGRTV